MVPCPECGERSRVLETRMTDKGWVYRRRICNDCAHRWTTFEIPEDSIQPVNDIEEPAT